MVFASVLCAAHSIMCEKHAYELATIAKKRKAEAGKRRKVLLGCLRNLGFDIASVACGVWGIGGADAIPLGDVFRPAIALQDQPQGSAGLGQSA